MRKCVKDDYQYFYSDKTYRAEDVTVIYGEDLETPEESWIDVCNQIIQTLLQEVI